MADDAQTPRAFVALDLRAVCYATSHTQPYGVTHGTEVWAPRAFLALDLHFASYATPNTNGVTHGGEVQAPRALVALDLRVICYATSYIGHRRVKPRSSIYVA